MLPGSAGVLRREKCDARRKSDVFPGTQGLLRDDEALLRDDKCLLRGDLRVLRNVNARSPGEKSVLQEGSAPLPFS